MLVRAHVALGLALLAWAAWLVFDGHRPSPLTRPVADVSPSLPAAPAGAARDPFGVRDWGKGRDSAPGIADDEAGDQPAATDAPPHGVVARTSAALVPPWQPPARSQPQADANQARAPPIPAGGDNAPGIGLEPEPEPAPE